MLSYLLANRNTWILFLIFIKINSSQWYCYGIAYKTATYNTAIVCGCRFDSQLIHYKYNSLLMYLGKHRKWVKCLNPYTCIGEQAEAPDLCLLPSPAPEAEAIGRVIQWAEVYLSPPLSALCLPGPLPVSFK